MAFTVKVKVLRHMVGDKDYKPGDFRSLPLADAERLADAGSVKIVGKPSNAAKPKAAKKVKGAKPKAAKAVQTQVVPRRRNQAAPPLTTK